MLSQSDIARDLHNLGLQPADRVLVHSSLKSLGPVDGGPNAVINAILDVIGPAGTLLVPTNIFLGSVTIFLRQTQAVDLRQAPSLMGLITETLRLRPGTIRSIHPSHPVAAMGASAHELLADHHLGDSPCGSLSPYGKLAKLANGKVLLIGVTAETMTLLHTAEEYFAPYLFCGEQFTIPVTATDGSIHHVIEKGYCMNTPRNFPALDKPLAAAGMLRRATLGHAQVTLLHAPGVLNVARQALLDNPRFLLKNG